MSTQFTINPKLDFSIERFIDAPTRLVWDALTKPEHLKEWYMPKSRARQRRQFDFHQCVESARCRRVGIRCRVDKRDVFGRQRRARLSRRRRDRCRACSGTPELPPRKRDVADVHKMNLADAASTRERPDRRYVFSRCRCGRGNRGHAISEWGFLRRH